MRPCTQCGRCCTNPQFMGGMTATEGDVRLWKREGRDDILAWVEPVGSPSIRKMLGWSGAADLWINPRTGDDAARCPFVRKLRNQNKYTCTIYATRPEVCRQFPSHVSHARFVDCDMVEPGDTNADVERFMLEDK